MNTGTLAVLLVLGFPILIVGGFFLIWALKIIRGDGKKDDVERANETKLIQEMFQGLAQMETRIEALETILLDSSRKDSDDES